MRTASRTKRASTSGYVQATGSRLRRCVTCEAAPGHSCGRWNGLGVWKTIKRDHKER